MRAPLSHVDGNLLFGAEGADVWALFELDAIAYPHLTASAKLELLARVEALAQRLEADSRPARGVRALSEHDPAVLLSAEPHGSVSGDGGARQRKRSGASPHCSPWVALAAAIRIVRVCPGRTRPA